MNKDHKEIWVLIEAAVKPGADIEGLFDDLLVEFEGDFMDYLANLVFDDLNDKLSVWKNYLNDWKDKLGYQDKTSLDLSTKWVLDECLRLLKEEKESE